MSYVNKVSLRFNRFLIRFVWDFSRRKPAWCDRILYRVNKNNYENVTLDAVQKSYISHSEYVLSDHKPVTADFVIKVMTNSISFLIFKAFGA